MYLGQASSDDTVDLSTATPITPPTNPPTAIPATTPPELQLDLSSLLSFIPNTLNALFASTSSAPQAPNVGSPTNDTTALAVTSPTAPLVVGSPSGAPSTNYSTTQAAVSPTSIPITTTPDLSKWLWPIGIGLTVWMLLKPGKA